MFNSFSGLLLFCWGYARRSQPFLTVGNWWVYSYQGILVLNACVQLYSIFKVVSCSRLKKWLRSTSLSLNEVMTVSHFCPLLFFIYPDWIKLSTKKPTKLELSQLIPKINVIPLCLTKPRTEPLKPVFSRASDYAGWLSHAVGYFPFSKDTVLFRVLMNFMIDFEIYRICLTQLKEKLKCVVIECIGVPI